MAFGARTVSIAAFLCVTTVIAEPSPVQEQNRNLNPPQQWVARAIAEHIWNYQLTSEKNPECTRHFNIYREHLSNFTLWAVQMLDASDVVPSGLLAADIFKLGNFEECINTKVPTEYGFTAQYCLPTINFNRTNLEISTKHENEWEDPVWIKILNSRDRRKAPKDRFTFALCIPSTCSSEDLKISLQSSLEVPLREAAYDINVTLDNLLCTTMEGPPGSLGSMIMKYFLVGLTGLFLFCSITDLVLAGARGDDYDITNFSFSKAVGIQKWLLPFSLCRNVFQLTAQPTSPDEYRILHGLKATLMMFIIMAHIALFRCGKVPFVNWSYTEDKMARSSITYIIGGLLPDVFFCMTGFTVCQSMLNQLEKGSFNVRTHIANKLLRVLPPYIFVIACMIFVLPYLGSGPIWRTFIEPEVEFCRNNWWLNLLFVNNYFRIGEWCLPQSYYIAADMHFFIVGSLIVYLCWRWAPYKLVILGSALFLTFLLPFLTVFRNEYNGFLRLDYEFLTDQFRKQPEVQHVYMKSHCRSGGYIVGITAAFVLRHFKKTDCKLSKGMSWAGVLFAVCILFGTLLAKYVLYNSSPSLMIRAIHTGLSTQLIGGAFMIVIVIQITSDLGAWNKILFTQDVFIPFSRITYWLYLLNVPIVMALIGSLKTPIHMTYEETGFLGRHLGDFFPIYAFAIYGYLTIEAPITHLKPKILRFISGSPSPTDKKNQ
nr:PREDICTED: nose resistant to fluoxetine protein 6-like [Bemisia tabaci]XP_018909875.1 PREDICTED: nose resistant to fluoxetine protein 6-like [Bemisia tabaci]XP_018909878.1 PREDICTED: nose resistant to fluoxetine protein 6-like [Bemisia tabaci]XP_018909879.1 PREDICTED: nose resistant to fluoxetine protein 6-like [Bemisia tabaci]